MEKKEDKKIIDKNKSYDKLSNLLKQNMLKRKQQKQARENLKSK